MRLAFYLHLENPRATTRSMKIAPTAILLAGLLLLASTGCRRHTPDPITTLPGAQSSDNPNYLSKTEEETLRTADAMKSKIDKDAADAQDVLRSQQEKSERSDAADPASSPASQTQKMIDNAKYLFAARKYSEALKLTDSLLRRQLTTEQQTAVNILRAEIQKEISAASGSAGKAPDVSVDQPR
jgi:hypothetical protein